MTRTALRSVYRVIQGLEPSKIEAVKAIGFGGKRATRATWVSVIPNALCTPPKYFTSRCASRPTPRLQYWGDEQIRIRMVLLKSLHYQEDNNLKMFAEDGVGLALQSRGCIKLDDHLSNCTQTTVRPAAGAVSGKRLSDERLVVLPATMNLRARIWAVSRAHVVQATLCCVSSVGISVNLCVSPELRRDYWRGRHVAGVIPELG
ncbi:hypothetical protein Acr_27g0009940 [Actinidia rufa]|uniref:Uncharacterized protein n=1 Tax=Actinidia rufa TaxID=165716 RepID=A0A7J0H8H7_9ERIC|nr:hypothetical protein Acr_27g0009940 [Actinidia rufa]